MAYGLYKVGLCDNEVCFPRLFPAFAVGADTVVVPFFGRERPSLRLVR